MSDVKFINDITVLKSTKMEDLCKLNLNDEVVYMGEKGRWAKVTVKKNGMIGFVLVEKLADKQVAVHEDVEDEFPDDFPQEPVLRAAKKPYDWTWLANLRDSFLGLPWKKIRIWTLRIIFGLFAAYLLSRVDWKTLSQETGKYATLGAGIFLGIGNMMVLIVVAGTVMLIYTARVANTFKSREYASRLVYYTMAMMLIGYFWLVSVYMSDQTSLSMILGWFVFLSLVPFPLNWVHPLLIKRDFVSFFYGINVVLTGLAFAWVCMDWIFGDTTTWKVALVYLLPVITTVVGWNAPGIYTAIREAIQEALEE